MWIVFGVAGMSAVSWKLSAQMCHRELQYSLDGAKQESRPDVETVSTYFTDTSNGIHTEFISERQDHNVCVLKHLKVFVLHKKESNGTLALEWLWAGGGEGEFVLLGL